MTILLRRTNYVTSGSPPLTYTVRADEALGHLLILASGGVMDSLVPGFSEDTASDPDWSTITISYDTPPDVSTARGRVQQRMLDLIASPTPFQIVGVDEATIWSTGASTAASPAFALGNTLFYATSVCNGEGRFVIGSGGSQPCTPVVGILYHELAHAFRGHPSGFDDAAVAADEAEAVTDENELRSAMGLAARSTTDLRSACGCSGPGGGSGGGCCIIASVSTGAPYGQEVNALRTARDHFFRATELGDAFFDELHREYYSFSIEVCRIMVCSEPARREVERVLVRPLVAVLRFFRQCTTTTSPAPLAASYREARSEIEAVRTGRSGLGRVVRDAYRGRVLVEARSEDPQVARIETLLAERLPATPHVSWAIGGPLALFLDSVEALELDADDDAIATWWRHSMTVWLAEMPLSSTAHLPAETWTRELSGLLEHVVHDEPTRLALIAGLRQRGGCA